VSRKGGLSCLDGISRLKLSYAHVATFPSKASQTHCGVKVRTALDEFLGRILLEKLTARARRANDPIV